MKNQPSILVICLLAALALPGTLKAQTNSGLQEENSQALTVNQPDSSQIMTSLTSTDYAIRGLTRTQGTTAGAPMKESKELTTPSVAPESEDGFSAPAAYAEYRYAQIQDNRTVGFDGPQHNGIVGFDFESFCKTIVGFNFTYTNSNLETGSSAGLGPDLLNSSDGYFFSTYVAKNFDDWVNVGTSLTYGRTDSRFRANFGGIAPFMLDQDTTQDSFVIAPFVGVAHTWGAFSFSSTPTYIWDYDHYSFGPTKFSGSDAAAPPDAKTLNQTFLWLNNFQYAVNDKLSLSIQINWTHLLTAQAPTVAPGLPIPTFSHQWMSFGGRADYAFNKDGTVFAAFEHDAFSTHFDDYRIRTGVSYNF